MPPIANAKNSIGPSLIEQVSLADCRKNVMTSS
eukprot:CAMPEP_0201619428 /NCGR_PEP_ID=MMETSP0492-20130828/41558_1 /ASSEMBLY_ACC=CAM_ASM_000837 /TAXON_ID=420259 /ORGANISM="Thalassiosira gravida, Strain GMp14c1" /LENGTH=32 /DNA_ID= /DNA_START= /DNA_END= /DNA_ORIENTATION=